MPGGKIDCPNDEQFCSDSLAKADIFQIWIYISEDSEGAANRVERAIYDACAFVAEGPLPRACQAESHSPWASIQDPDSLSQLHHRLSARYSAACRRRRGAWKTKHQARPERAAGLESQHRVWR